MISEGRAIMRALTASACLFLAVASAGLLAQTVPTQKTAPVAPKTAPAPAPKTAPAPAPKSASPRAADEAAILATNAAFTKAFDAGDAKAVAALFTEDAELTDEAGEKTKGREAIAAQLADLFATTPGQTIELTADSLEFLGTDVAKEEGRAKITPPGGIGARDFTRYTVIHVRRDGKWLAASERDEPDTNVRHRDRLEELAWMVGEWVNETEGSVVFTSCDWVENGSFLLRAFNVHLQGKPAMSGHQRIGWDPLTKQLKSWVFDSEGGYGEALWTREGNTWVVKATGVLADGKIATATHMITLEGKDLVRWRSTDRTLGNKPEADVEEIVLVRKPPKPR